MNLQQFITESLRQIIKGVIEADEALASVDAAINPRSVVTNKSGEGPYGFLALGHDGSDKFRRSVQSIEFDVAITVREDSENKAGIGLHIGAIGIGSAAKQGTTNDSVSRLRFAIPVMLPQSKQV